MTAAEALELANVINPANGGNGTRPARSAPGTAMGANTSGRWIRLLVHYAAVVYLCAACGSPTTPSEINSVTVIDVGIPSDSVRAYGAFVPTTIQFHATKDLLVPSTLPGTVITIQVSYLVFVCLSADGIHFAADCIGASGFNGDNIPVGVPSPTAESGITQTNTVVAFMIRTRDYRPPFDAGRTVPATALAKDLKPWIIRWQ